MIILLLILIGRYGLHYIVQQSSVSVLQFLDCLEQRLPPITILSIGRTSSDVLVFNLTERTRPSLRLVYT